MCNVLMIAYNAEKMAKLNMLKNVQKIDQTSSSHEVRIFDMYVITVQSLNNVACLNTF